MTTRLCKICNTKEATVPARFSRSSVKTVCYDCWKASRDADKDRILKKDKSE